jgi:DNA-binding NtrC family response regulator
MKVMFLDDDQDILDVYQSFFCDTQAGRYFTSPTTAMDMFRKHPFHIVVLDLNLGPSEIHGLEVAKKILSTNPNTPIIVVAGHIPKLIENELGQTAAFVRFITKPKCLESLKKEIKNAKEFLNRLSH